MSKLISVLLLTLTSSFLARAAELYEMNTSVRALGMGNAYTAIVQDKDSLFYNPAGLAKIRGINLTIMDPRLGIDGQDVINTVNSANAGGSSTDLMRALFGKKIWLGAGAKAALAIPGFAFAIYDSAEVAAHLSNPAFPNMNLRYINDYGAAIGMGVDVGEVFQVGVAAKRITRSGGEFPLGLSTLGTLSNADITNQLSNQGTGYTLDLGTSLTIPAPIHPVLSLVWKQIGSTTFSKDNGTAAPPRILDEIIFGFASVIDMPGLSITPAIDFKHILQYEEQLGKKFHVGLELDLPVFAVRGGFNQGYWTLGAGVDLTFLRIDAATYGVELGEYPGQFEDRRYVLQATMELGLDPGFGFGGGTSGRGGSRNRSVKPRR